MPFCSAPGEEKVHNVQETSHHFFSMKIFHYFFSIKIFHSSVKSTSPWWVCVTWQGIVNHICWKRQMSRNKYFDIVWLSWVCSVQFSHSVMSDSLQSHGLQHARPLCPSPTPRVNLHSCPSSRWCHPTISSSVVTFSSRLQSFPASGSFPMSQLSTSGGQRIGASPAPQLKTMLLGSELSDLRCCFLV